MDESDATRDYMCACVESSISVVVVNVAAVHEVVDVGALSISAIQWRISIRPRVPIVARAFDCLQSLEMALENVMYMMEKRARPTNQSIATLCSSACHRARAKRP